MLSRAALRAYRTPRVQAMLARLPGDVTLAPSPGAGALVVCRDGTPGFTDRAFQVARERGIPLIYDTDDLLIALPDDSPFAARFRPMRSMITRWIRQADHLTVANTALAEVLAELNPSISILPSFIDVDLWGVSPVPLPDAGPVSIGFWGCMVHVPDLQRLTAVFRHLKQRYGRRIRFQFMGCHAPDMLALEDVSVGAFVNSYAGYAAATRDCRLDIAIAPMDRNRFNRCKSPIKFFEYSIRGACGIYTDFDPYQSVVRQGENGFLVGSGADEWLGALERLIDNPDLRYRMAGQAQADVLTHHTLDHHAWRWREAYITAIERCLQSRGNAE
jgi:glycosyltransferase involved in cell wall biosynthesis